MAKLNATIQTNRGLNVTFANTAKQNISMTASQLAGTLNSLVNVDTTTQTEKTGDVLVFDAITEKYSPKSNYVHRNANNETVITGHLAPVNPNIDLGVPENPFRSLYVQSNTIIVGNLSISDSGGGQLVLGSSLTGEVLANFATLENDGTAQFTNLKTVSETGEVLPVATVQYVNARISGDASQLTLGGDFANTDILPDGSINDGAVTSFANTQSVLTAIDKLNETMLNIQKSAYVRDVTFTSDITAGGVGSSATLTISTVNGNPNQYDINWGDGAWTNATSDSTPTHTYNTTVGTPFDVTVYARNTNGSGEGSNASFTRVDYITIYTADPSPAFSLYNNVTGPSVITEANTGEAIYLYNTTTNVANDATTATFSVNWGDGGSVEGIDSKVDAGGPQGSRLAHTYSADSGTGTFTVTMSINSHSTATPGLLPLSSTTSLKVFDLAIAAPDDLTTKTISWSSSSVGSSPKLAQGFTDNATGKSAGDSISSSFPRFTSGTVSSASMSTFFHTTGSVTQQINDTTAGSPTVDSQNVDYYNYNSSGTSVSSGSRIYAPGLYETGTKARVSYNVTSGSAGVNKAELVSTEGNSNELFYVYDTMTSAPTVDVSSATVTEGTANYRYISGIPFYDDNSTLTLGNIQVTNLTGQTYYGSSNPFTIGAQTADPISGSEDDETGGIIGTANKDYSQIVPAANRSANIPNAGLTSAITLEDQTVTVYESARRVGQFTFTARNVNGSDTEAITSPYILVHTLDPAFDETAIAVEDALGATYTTDATRITGFSGATPAFGSTTDYYADNAWSGAVTVAGTDEAIFWLGTLKHFVYDLSSGYLPAGPDLATGRSGTQYARFAFKRSAVSNFRIRLTGKVSGFYYAAPGTDIDNASTISGWVDASIQYNGSGYPGADTGNGGNGSNGGAFTGADRIIDGTTYSNDTFDLTFGTVTTSDSYNNQVLISIALNSDDYITALSIEDAD